jgi:hypothetical protein
MPKGNINNLTANSLPAEVRRENARKAGIASGKAKRKRKEMRELAEALLEVGIHNGRVQDVKSLDDVNNKNVSVAAAILLAQIKKAIRNGDTRAAEFIRDTAGQNPLNIPPTVEESTSDGFIEAMNEAAGGIEWDDSK